MGHTPGPWEVDGNVVRASDPRVVEVVAMVYHHWPLPDPMKANARLIAAAPDLLEAAIVALASIQVHSTIYSHGPYQAIDTLRAAIEKATGEAVPA